MSQNRCFQRKNESDRHLEITPVTLSAAKGLARRTKRSFAEFTLSEANGLRMTARTPLTSAHGKPYLQMSAKAHEMRNEIYHSNEVALDSPSWHSCFFDEEVFLQNCKQALMDGREGVGSGHMIFALVVSSEGDDTFLIETFCLPLPPNACWW